MPRGSQVFVRALAGLALVLVTACSAAAAPAAGPVTVADTSAVEITTVVDTTAPAPTTSSTTISETTILETTIPETATASVQPTTTPAPAIDPNCPITPHAAVIDRDRQRAWLCDNGVALPEFVITTARTLPDPGTYPVFAKDMNTSSAFGGHYSTMTHFVAFTRGENTGARVAFHTIPVLRNGDFVQPLESVGTEERHGDSAGCIRVLPEQGQVVWDWLEKGDEVRVLT